MAVRSARERVVQTLWFEGVGLGLVAPLYAAFGGAGVGESFVMVAAVALVVMAWAAAFNTAFDAVEWRITGRVASARPRRVRLLHAASFELTAMLVTVPVIHALDDMSWLQALQLDVALTLAYMAYGYAFHRVYDHLRPVRTDASGSRHSMKPEP